jgi:pyruvate/2-oxoglutarate dehydrogenase complex dihydrolipoamide acyltransferase (E2) component
MAIKFGMPSLGHTMEKGKIIEWLKQEGETLA